MTFSGRVTHCQSQEIRDVELTGCRPEHSIVRDMFLFACYTGTSYVDVVAITPDNLSKDDQGAPWLKYRRGPDFDSLKFHQL